MTGHQSFEGGRNAEAAWPDSISLQDVLLLKVGLSWQETVAILLEAVSDLPEGSSCPDPSLVTLTAMGEARVARGRGLTGPPVPHAAGLLLELLADAPAPPELTSLLAREAADPPEHASLRDFSRALAYFERPNRRADVAAVHARVQALSLKSPVSAELQRLRAKASVVTAQPDPARVRLSAAIGARAGTLMLNALLLTTIAGSVTALVAVALGPSSSQPSPGDLAIPAALAGVVHRTGNAVNRALEAGRASLGTGLGTSPAGPARDRTLEVAAPARRARSTPAAAAPAGPRGPESAPDVDGAPRTPVTGDKAPFAYTISVRALDFSNPDDLNLAAPYLDARDAGLPPFEAGDEGISPATLVRPQLPTAPIDTRLDEPLSVFDLVISELGRVEQVRLISPSGRFNDRMLVSAAKAWIFRPALKNGFPVRYRLRVRITQ